MIPVEIARDIIITGRRSALAQICKLDEDMLRNHRSLMRRETSRAPQWSDQQVVYINMLHLTTVQIFTGDLTITIEEGGKRKIVDTEPDKKRKPTCTESEAEKLKEQIATYVAQGPKLEEAPAVTTKQPATPPAPVQPTSNPPAKKP